MTMEVNMAQFVSGNGVGKVLVSCMLVCGV